MLIFITQNFDVNMCTDFQIWQLSVMQTKQVSVENSLVNVDVVFCIKGINDSCELCVKVDCTVKSWFNYTHLCTTPHSVESYSAGLLSLASAFSIFAIFEFLFVHIIFVALLAPLKRDSDSTQ